MKNIILLFVLAVLATFSGCIKEKSGFGSTDKISGNLIVADTLSNGTIPVPGAMVYIGFDYKPNAVDYSYKVTTDKEGHFEIPFLNSEGSYQLYAVKNYVRDGVEYLFSFDTVIDSPKENLTFLLSPDLKAGRLSGIVSMHDSLTNGSMNVASAGVYIGYNFVPNTTHYTYKLLTDANGFFISPLIPVSDIENYHLFSTKTIDIGGQTIIFSRVRTFSEFSAGGNLLELLPVDSIGFIRISILDASGNTPQPYISWCLYADALPFYWPKPCEGSFYTSTTNINGLGYVSGLTKNGKYYIKGYKPYGSDTLWVKDSLVIPAYAYPHFTFRIKL